MRRIGSLLTLLVATTWGLAAFAQSPEAVSTAMAKRPAPEKEENTMVIIKTSKGDIKVELFDKEAPISVKNFLEYVDAKHYDGTIFHRVIDGFMIQGGGFTKDFEQKPNRDPIKNEAQNGLKNKKGTLAMARTSVIDSATSQFFINVVDNGFLDHRAPNAREFGYCVFGKVAEGMDVVDQLKGVATGQHGPHANVPVEPIEILEVVRAE